LKDVMVFEVYMRNESEEDFALARKRGLIVQEADDELLVYDLERDKACCLNHSAAAVWKRCDGRTTPTEIARLLQKEIGAPIDEKFVWLALESLGRDHLLERRLKWPDAIPRISRRTAIGRIGLGAAIALPLVISITAPSPVQAATCRQSGQSCTTSVQCCSNLCQGNGVCL
jgi:hypothetical protein